MAITQRLIATTQGAEKSCGHYARGILDATPLRPCYMDWYYYWAWKSFVEAHMGALEIFVVRKEPPNVGLEPTTLGLRVPCSTD